MFCLLSINIGPYSHVNSPAHCWDVTLYLSKTSPLAWPPPITPARTAQPIFHLSPSNWTPDPATDSFPAVPIIINPTANPSLTCTQERKKKKKKEGRSRKRRRSVVKKKSNWESSVSSHRTLKAHPSPSHITPSAEALDPEEKKKKKNQKKNREEKIWEEVCTWHQLRSSRLFFISRLTRRHHTSVAVFSRKPATARLQWSHESAPPTSSSQQRWRSSQFFIFSTGELHCRRYPHRRHHRRLLLHQLHSV